MPLPPGIAGVRVTLREMARLARQGTESQALRQWLHRELQRNKIAGHDHESEIEFCFWHAQTQLTFRRDPVEEEHLTNPLRILDYFVNPDRYGNVLPAEDCDGKSVWFASLMGALGHRCRFVVTQTTNGEYTHVYPEFFWRPTGEWVPADPTPEINGVRPQIGWEPPAANRIVFPIWQNPKNRRPHLGFDPTGAIGTGVSIVGGLFGRKKQRQAAERLRDSVWQASLDQIVDLRKAVESRVTDPTAAILQAQQIYAEWRRTTDALPDSVRKSAYTDGKKGEKSHLFWMDTALADLRREAQKAQGEQRQAIQAAQATPTPSQASADAGRPPLLPGSGPGGTNPGGVPVALIGVGAALIVGFFLLK
jgi:hypothetical protein